MKHIVENTAYYLLYGLLYMFALLPMTLLYLLSDVLYYVVYYIIRYRRKVVRQNIAMAFPEKDESERRVIERRFFHFLTDYVVETIKVLHISDAGMKRLGVDTVAYPVVRQQPFCGRADISSVAESLFRPPLSASAYPVRDRMHRQERYFACVAATQACRETFCHRFYGRPDTLACQYTPLGYVYGYAYAGTYRI